MLQDNSQSLAIACASGSFKSAFVHGVLSAFERSNAWLDRCKSLVKIFDRTLERANAKLKLCFIRLMLKRLAATATP